MQSYGFDLPVAGRPDGLTSLECSPDQEPHSCRIEPIRKPLEVLNSMKVSRLFFLLWDHDHGALSIVLWPPVQAQLACRLDFCELEDEGD